MLPHTLHPECGYRTAREALAPLTIIDARMPATVERWLDAWLTGTGRGAYMVSDSLRVVCGATGYLQTSESATSWNVTLTHADRASLVAYVVAWARNA